MTAEIGPIVSRVRNIKEARRVYTEIISIKDNRAGFGAEANDHYRIDRSIIEYLEMLPRFGGKNFVQTMEEKIAGAISPVTVLDIGCGNGDVLGLLAASYPEIQATGISATDLRRKIEPEKRPSVEKIDYRVGDMHDLKKIVDGQQFDIITSLWALSHGADPLTVVKQAYQVLKPDGVAFLQNFGPMLSNIEARSLEYYWGANGIEAELTPMYKRADVVSEYNLSFQKSDARKMHMPFRYGPSAFDFIYYELDFHA